jgi:hypothetical protein
MTIALFPWLLDLPGEISPVNPTIRILGPTDATVLDRVAPGVFDNPVDPRWTAEFLADVRHHLAAALDGDQVRRS